MTIAIINCAKRKQDYPCTPREMYWPSLLFRSQVQYIEKRYDNWVILSSHYGVVTQDQIIEPYDAYLGSSCSVVDKDTKRYTLEERRAWGRKVIDDLRKLIKDYDKVDAFLAEVYYKPLPHPIPLPIRFMKINVNIQGRGFFKVIRKWEDLSLSDKTTDEHLSLGDFLYAGTKKMVETSRRLEIE